MPATVNSLEQLKRCKLPFYMFLDTSFLTRALAPTQYDGGADSIANQCYQLLIDLRDKAEKGETCLFINHGVFDEFLFFILKTMV